MTGTIDRLRSVGLDLQIVAALTLVAVAVLLSPLYGSPLALLLGIPFLLFVPGYAVVSALFPEQPPIKPRGPLAHRHESPGWLVRLALSLVVSGLVVGLVGLVLSWLLTITLLSLAAAITVLTVCGVAVAAVRRSRLPPVRRADPFAGRSLVPFPGGASRQSITLGIAVVALLLATVFVGLAPAQGQDYSEAYLLSENGQGELVAEEYPSTFVAGEGHQLSLALSNHENEPVAYEVVVVAQRVGPDGDVTEREQVDRFAATLDHGETTVADRQIDPTMTGQDIRLQFLVYEGTTPGSGVEADHVLQLWVDVEAAS